MITDDEILRHLVHQVSRATPKGKTEAAVTTIITRPMWNAFCRAINIPEDSEPTGWIGPMSVRVYGSNTIVVDMPEMAAISFANY